MQPDDPGAARELGRFWDAHLGGEPVAPGEIDPALAETIQHLHALDATPSPDAVQIARIWETAGAAAGITVPLIPSPERAFSPNGHHPPQSATRIAIPPKPSLAVQMGHTLSPVARFLAIGVIAGMIAGAITGGLGSRVVMLIIAQTTESWQRGALTDEGNRVGAMTLDGTIFLLFFGAGVGMLAGVAFLAIRPWLPWSGFRRGILFGFLLFALGGTALFENGENPDYQRFGYVGLNICLFGALPILFGALVGPVADWLDRTIRIDLPANRAGARLTSIGLILCAVLVTPLLAVAVTNPSLQSFMLIGPLVARLTLRHWIGRFDHPADLLRRPRLAIATYGVFAVPTLAGLALTMQVIGKIISSN
jgi:hypothetical protein